jgi:hypothetical protein
MYSFLCPKEFFGEKVCLEHKYDVGLLGKSHDTRGNVSRVVVREQSTKQIELDYFHETLTVNVNAVETGLKAFFECNLFEGVESILIDATNLAFAEIAAILRLARNTKSVSRISFFYCEPDKYNMKVWTPVEIRGFELTETLHKVDFIPTFYNQGSQCSSKYLLAFLGFEDNRFSRIIDPDLGADYNSIGAAFSVPPFQTGFDTHSFMANSRVLHDNQIEEPFFVAGNQPYDAYHLIERLKKMCYVNSQELVIAPIGTKPTAIATALAAAEDSSISVVFDFPTKREQRSRGIGKSHYFPIELK